MAAVGAADTDHKSRPERVNVGRRFSVQVTREGFRIQQECWPTGAPTGFSASLTRPQPAPRPGKLLPTIFAKAFGGSAYRPEIIEREMKLLAILNSAIDKLLARYYRLEEARRLYAAKDVQESKRSALTDDREGLS